MYTATLKNKRPVDGGTYYDVEFLSDSGEPLINKSYLVKDDESVERVRRQSNELLVLLNNKKEIEIGNITETKTQAMIDRETWNENLLRLENLQKLVQLGVITGQENYYTNLQQKVKLGLKAEYLI